MMAEPIKSLPEGREPIKSMPEGRDMCKLKFATSCLLALLCIADVTSPAKSADRPSMYLKDVLLIPYSIYHDQSLNIGPCAIDWEALNVSIDFVANQSIPLKLMRPSDYEARGALLSKKVSEAIRNLSDTYGEAWETLSRHNFAPRANAFYANDAAKWGLCCLGER